MEVPTKIGVFDAPRADDYKWSELKCPTLYEKKPLPKFTMQNQKATNGCSMFALTHIVNIQNIREYDSYGKQFTEYEAMPIWEEFCKNVNPKAETDGTSLQSVLEFMRKKKVIAGYVQVETNDEMDQAIRNGNLILTGFPDIRYSQSTPTGVITFGGQQAPHAMPIVDFDGDFGYRVPNSYGPEWGYTNGWFKLKREDIGKTMTKYAVFDKPDPKFTELRKQKKLASLYKQLVDCKDYVQPSTQKEMQDVMNILTQFGYDKF